MQDILQQYGVPPDALLGAGMEARAYAYGANKVLKIYHGTTSLAHLATLQRFYDSLDRSRVPYALPRIHSIAQEGDVLVTIEQRLHGTPLSEVLPSLSEPQLEQVMARYLLAVQALSAIHAPPAFDRCKLFDAEHISRRADGDWHQFLDRYLALKLAQLMPYVSRDVSQLHAKLQRLRAILAQPYTGEYRLIHGDFFPGNLLVDDDLQITSLLDFGMWTMYGDALFDLATSIVFFDMYDQLHADLRSRLFAMVRAAHGGEIMGVLGRYVLLYSLVSANAYAADCSDGHYAWCIANLNDQHLWDAVV
jgi:aminoglycoside phosphotransferase (APT) family kinase protein